MSEKILVKQVNNGCGCGGCATAIVALLLGCAAIALFFPSASTTNSEASAQKTAPPQPAAPDVRGAPENPPGENFWPKKVITKKEIFFSLKNADGVVNARIPAGAEVDVIDFDGKIMTARRGEMTAIIPAAETDFWQRAEEARARSTPR